MKVLVAYMTSTGNTKKVAEAIYGEIEAEKEIKPISDVQDVGSYDLAFLGFPTHGYGPDKKTKKILGDLCTMDRKVALFVTHGAPESEPEVQQWMEKFKDAAKGAEVVGLFDCQGQLAASAKFVMRLMGKKQRDEARRDNSQGQPDQTRLERARAFARDTMKNAVITKK